MRRTACVALLCALVAVALVRPATAVANRAYPYGYGGYPAAPLPVPFDAVPLAFPPPPPVAPYLLQSQTHSIAADAAAEEQAAVAAAAAAASLRVERARRLEFAAERTAIADARATAQVHAVEFFLFFLFWLCSNAKGIHEES